MDPFRAGELGPFDAERLGQLERRLDQLERISGELPIQVAATGGVPVVSLDMARPLLAEVVSSTGSPPVHTVKRKTKDSSNAVIDYVPTTTIDKVLASDGGTIADGSEVQIVPIIDQPGWWWGFPAAGSEICFQVVTDVVCDENGLTVTTAFVHITGAGLSVTVDENACPSGSGG